MDDAGSDRESTAGERTAPGGSGTAAVVDARVGDRSTAMAVLEVVAACTGREVTDLPSLQAAVDTDALETLATPSADRPAGSPRVTFTYAGCRVSVDAGGQVFAVLNE